MYYFGHGVPVNRAEGRRWFRKAAAQGDTYALSAISEQLTTCKKFALLTGLLVVCFLLSTLSPPIFWKTRESLREPRQQLVTATGVLCLCTAGVNWYGYTHNKIRCPICGHTMHSRFSTGCSNSRGCFAHLHPAIRQQARSKSGRIDSTQTDLANEDQSPAPQSMQ